MLSPQPQALPMSPHRGIYILILMPCHPHAIWVLPGVSPSPLFHMVDGITIIGSYTLSLLALKVSKGHGCRNLGNSPERHTGGIQRGHFKCGYPVPVTQPGRIGCLSPPGLESSAGLDGLCGKHSNRQALHSPLPLLWIGTSSNSRDLSQRYGRC